MSAPYFTDGTSESPSQRVTALFAEVRRVLAVDGTLWLNIGDSYSAGRSHSDNGTGGSGLTGTSPTGGRWVGPRLSPDRPPKNLLGIPWRTAFALQDDGWILRNDVIWSKPNAMPESVTDRLSTRHEHLFMLSKSPRYWFDLDPIREQLIHPGKTGHTFGGNSTEISRTRGGVYKPKRPDEAWNAGTGLSPHMGYRGTHESGRNPGDVWTIPTQPFASAHFATFPPVLAERAILAGCKPGGTVLDPFSGSGTTGLAATKHGRRYVGIDLSRDYLDLSLRTRFAQPGLDFGEPA